MHILCTTIKAYRGMQSQRLPYNVTREVDELHRLEAEKKDLENKRLFILWERQEANRNPKLREELRVLELKSQSEYQKNQVLQAQLAQYKEELRVWETRLITYLQMNQPLGVSIQSLYSSNQNLKHEIRQLYDGDLNNFQLLETKARNMRMSNNNLESEINRLSHYLFDFTRANEALSSEIRYTKAKIKGVEDHLRRKQSSASSTRNVPYNPVQVHTTTDDQNLQLPQDQPDAEHNVRNRDFIKNNKNSKCSVCMDELNDSRENGLIVVTPCGHRFHRTCILKVLRVQNRCPDCRNQIDSQSLTLQTNWDNTKKLYSCFHVKLT